MKQRICSTAAVTASMLLAGSASADVIFSNFGPGNDYFSGIGWFIGGFDSTNGVWLNQETAMPLAIEGASYRLQTVEAAIERSNNPPGTQDVTATIYSSSFVELGSTSVATNFPPSGGSGAPTQFDFSGQNLVLTEGETYYVSLRPTFEDQTYLIWGFNSEVTGTCPGFRRSLLTGGEWVPLTAICAAYRVSGEPVVDCTADLNGDGMVGFSDLTALLTAWTTSAGDLDGNGTTNFADLTALLVSWGECP